MPCVGFRMRRPASFRNIPIIRCTRPRTLPGRSSCSTRALLIDGTLDAVLNQHPQTVLLNAVRLFTNLREGRSAHAGVESVRISIVLRENLP